MNRLTIATLLVVYGIVGGLMNSLMGAYALYGTSQIGIYLYEFLNPLILFVAPNSTSNLIILNSYPFVMIALGFYVAISKRKRVR